MEDWSTKILLIVNICISAITPIMVLFIKKILKSKCCCGEIQFQGAEIEKNSLSLKNLKEGGNKNHTPPNTPKSPIITIRKKI